MTNTLGNPRDPGQVTYDVYLVGVGGQGVLTIGELIADAAFQNGIPVNFYPTKGMAQRGGSVKAQLRLGRATIGPTIPEKGADLVIATEVSEALKAVRYIKPGGDFVLFGYVWAPTAVTLGKAPYPALGQVLGAAREALGTGGRIHYISEASLPMFEGSAVPDNIFTLAVAVSQTRLSDLLPPALVGQAVRTRWRRGVERNTFAFQAGLDAQLNTAIAAQ
jgi:indolepyruvate ferredoxin oxidoreductase, beta subunit